MPTCSKCAKSWTGLKIEHCTTCHESFSSTPVGDAHRVGSHGVKDGPDRRRCLTPDEFANLRTKRGQIRYKRNTRGVWVGAGEWKPNSTTEGV